MPFNGSGSFAVYTPGNPVVTGTIIDTAVQNATNTDFATGLSNCVTRDGQSPATANIAMGGFKLTGLGAGSSAGESVRYEQFASPPAIGGTAPAAGTFTTLTSTGSAALGDSAAADTHTIKGATLIDVDSASSALEIRQIGAGNAFVVEDAANPDSTPTVITASGQVVVGHTAGLSIGGAVASSQVIGTSVATAREQIAIFSADASGSALTAAKSRNATIGSHTAVQASDQIFIIASYASDGSAWVNAANLELTVDAGASVSSGIVPTRASLKTMNASGTLTTGFYVDSSQIINAKQGNSSSFYVPSGPVQINTTAIGNVGAGEDNLRQYSLPTSAFSAAGKMIRWTATGFTANNANAKTLKFYFGTALLATVTLTAGQANQWKFVAHIASTGTDTQDYNYDFFQDGTVEQHILGTGTSTEDDGAAIVVKPTGEGVNTNDIVQEFQLVEFFNGT